MSKKFYRVKQDTFLWKKGAIIQNSVNDGKGYFPVEDIWDSTPNNGKEYISDQIIEHDDNKEYFERVYPDTITGKLYKTKDQLIETYNTTFNN